MNEYKNIRLKYEENIATLTFNRPDVLNALNTETLTETLDALQELGKNHEVRILILTGAGKAFVAGADISEISSKTPEDARRYSELGHTLVNTIQHMDKPVIAAINGYALGGGTEIALGCDIRLASENARFGLPETTVGVIPGWGGTQRAARLIGTALAKELIFTGEIISAQHALKIGLINRVVPHESLMDVTMDMARKISQQGQIALSHAKRVINEGVDKPFQEGCRMEIDAFVSCFRTEDQKEGMKAFIEKRKPNFKGR
jgi:enoyl-CoA hydratase